jgi:hypothetical protein
MTEVAGNKKGRRRVCCQRTLDKGRGYQRLLPPRLKGDLVLQHSSARRPVAEGSLFSRDTFRFERWLLVAVGCVIEFAPIGIAAHFPEVAKVVVWPEIVMAKHVTNPATGITRN